MKAQLEMSGSSEKVGNPNRKRKYFNLIFFRYVRFTRILERCTSISNAIKEIIPRWISAIPAAIGTKSPRRTILSCETLPDLVFVRS